MQDLLFNIVRRHFPQASADAVRERMERTEAWCREKNCRLVGPPPGGLLSRLPRGPSALFVRGDPEKLRALCLSVVGTRRPSPYGLRAAWAFGRGLARLGFTVVSGLARGVDAAAHRGALGGPGATVAVLGHGLDRIYPFENARLADEILASGGCLVSEYPPGVPPMKHHFPERNRIIAGLSLGVLVVEAAVKSGSLLTARHALENDREVFVIPGAFDDNGFEGSHRLIQEGAKLVRGIEDILDELPALAAAAVGAHESPPASRVSPRDASHTARTGTSTSCLSR